MPAGYTREENREYMRDYMTRYRVRRKLARIFDCRPGEVPVLLADAFMVTDDEKAFIARHMLTWRSAS